MIRRLPILDEEPSGCGAADCRDSAPRGPDLLVQLLADQQQLSAVDVFSRAHDQGAKGRAGRFAGEPGQRYRALLPAVPPGPGQQYAFEVDLDRCSGCKACVTACHSLNGLDEAEAWRTVGLLVGGSSTLPVVQHVTAACHHCLEPACMTACPVNAYEKDPLTGIVRHLDDQCFGCQYCTLACPYDVPKYHAGKGIVRKCDMCSSRLAVGEPPACVQACPHQAISIRLVDRQQVIDDAETSHLMPGAADSQITLPTTIYKSNRSLPRNLLPADYFVTRTEHAHLPLVVMLVLTQLSVGALVAGLVLKSVMRQAFAESLEPLLAVNAFGFGALAIASSVLHLGRPRFAFRAVLGLRHSWLSREILAFGLFASLAASYALSLQGWLPTSGWIALAAYRDALGWAAAASGGLALICSAMVYVFTSRECWSFARVAVRFVLTAALLGIALVWFSLLAAALVRPSPELDAVVRACGPGLCRAMIAAVSVKLVWELAGLRHLLVRRTTPMKRSAQLLIGRLSSVTLARFAAGGLGGLVMPALLLSGVDAARATGPSFTVVTAMMCLACLAGELLERYLFFSACATPRMPGTHCG